MPDPSISERILAVLRIEDGCQRMEALGELRDQAVPEILSAVVSLLRHPEQSIRRRAGGTLSFFKMSGVSVLEHADLLADNLEHGDDPRVRSSCAVALMSAPGQAVERAFLAALADPCEPVVLIACLEVGWRGGAEGTEALFRMLNHPQWRVRLEVCKALITQKTADQRVVSTLEAMSREAEAARYDLEVEESRESLEEFAKACCPEGNCGECWGKLETILAKARQIASPHGAR